ncbi:hypothetical protein SNE40_019534 [Patella caerulea]|uniref:Uncharacterized protein n=1 Tax=Patella caerulea TaxID=87958 RepID=A0AAN8J6N0_PATCE
MLYLLFVSVVLQTVLVGCAPPNSRQKREEGSFCILHGRDYSHGENFTVPESGPCVTYNCNHGSVRPIKLECRDGQGGCVPQGSEREYFCRTEVCEEWGNTIGFRTLHSSNCRDQFGECHPIGVPWTRDCQTYVCNKTNRNSFQIRTIAIQCQDAYGNCKELGESFIYAINRQLYNDCTCRQEGTRLRYECYT